MLTLEEAFPAALAARARGWCVLWGVAALGDVVQVRFSTRMFRTVGRCLPARRQVSFAAGVRALPAAQIADVLCHELAHIAAFELHGPAIRPHGSEWQALMRAAGCAPLVRFSDAAAIAAIRAHARLPVRYLHRCMSCGAARESTRRMPHWRCSPCFAQGRGGRLEIVRQAAGFGG